MCHVTVKVDLQTATCIYLLFLRGGVHVTIILANSNIHFINKLRFDVSPGGSPMETSAPVSVSVSGDEESGESADEDGIELLVSGKSLEEVQQLMG